MPDFLTRVRGVLVFGGLVCLALITMVSDRHDTAEGGGEGSWWSGAALEIAVPLQKIASVPVDALREVWDRYVDLMRVREENQRLRERLAVLEEESLQYREALVASGYLALIAEMRNDFEIPMLPTQIVGLDVSPWFRSALVDRGRDQDVLSGMPVVTDRGVVGLITATSRRASKTMLLLDRQSAVDGIIQRSRARGLVLGRGTDELDFEFVVRGSDVAVGDVVITSGLGGVYPKGLRIGEVVAVPDPGPGLLHSATLKPAVDFGRMEQLFVMLRRAPTMDLLYGAETPPAETTAVAEAAPDS